MSPSARAGDSFPAPRAASSIPSGASPPALAEFGVAAALAAPSAAAQHADGVQAPSDGASLPVGHPSCSEVPAQLSCPQQVTLVVAVAGWVPPHGAVGGQKRASTSPGWDHAWCRAAAAAEGHGRPPAPAPGPKGWRSHVQQQWRAGDEEHAQLPLLASPSGQALPQGRQLINNLQAPSAAHGVPVPPTGSCSPAPAPAPCSPAGPSEQKDTQTACPACLRS